MNVRPPIETSSPTAVLSVSFNNDCSYFSVGLETGMCIYHTKSCMLKSNRDFNAGIGLVQMMGMTNYLALVGGGKSPKYGSNKAIIWDDMKGRVALEITALSPVRGIQLGRERIAVVLQNSVRIYSFSRPPNLLHVYETADNIPGLCCMSDKKVAFPGRTVGQVQLVELVSGNVSIIPAHSGALRTLNFSPDGELIATASEQGTLVRVFSTRNCAKLAELRRGIDPATIFSLAFSPSGAMLALTSDKSTLHVFDVPHLRRNGSQRTQSSHNANSDAEQGKWGILSKIPLMPRVFSDVYSFASTTFEAGEEGSIGGISYHQASQVLGTARPPKGIIGWVGEDSLVVIGAGRDARWEKYNVQAGEDGKRYCVKEGWKRYLGNT